MAGKYSEVSTSTKDFEPDRRWNIWYAIHGSLMFRTDNDRYTAEPISLSLGGILFKADRLPPVNTSAGLKLNVSGFDEIIETSVRIVSIDGKFASALFIAPHALVVRCVAWLSRQEAEK